MPLLTPNSYGTGKGELREFNPCHEPAGTQVGGRFARRGVCHTPTTIPRATMDAVASFELNGDVSHLKTVFGRVMSKTELEAVARQMLAETEGVSFNIVATARDYFTPDGSKSATVIFRFIGTDGDPGAEDEMKRPTSLIRAFVRTHKQLIARHSSFEKRRSIPPGYGKDMLRGHMQAYQRLGVDAIETHANIDVGAYAWAKYGFVAQDAAEISTMIEDIVEGAHGTMVFEQDFVTGQRKGRGVGIGDNESRLLKGIGRSRDPRAIWAFADATLDGVKVGKVLLAQSSGWGATLDITGRTPLSRASMERFWAYVGRAKRPKTAAPPAKAREAVVIRDGGKSPKGKTPGELCEWDPFEGRYTDRRIWGDLLDGDTRFVYDLRDPQQRKTYQQTTASV